MQVFAVAVSANVATAGSVVGATGAKRIQEAMTYAVEWCYKNGITEPDKIREYMLLAREETKRQLTEEAVTPEGN